MGWCCGKFFIGNIQCPTFNAQRNFGQQPPNESSGVNIVLLQPEIPPNTGNVARLCAATKSTLHLIEPFGFKLDDSQLKRAGMDYWQHVQWHRWANWKTFEQN